MIWTQRTENKNRLVYLPARSAPCPLRCSRVTLAPPCALPSPHQSGGATSALDATPWSVSSRFWDIMSFLVNFPTTIYPIYFVFHKILFPILKNIKTHFPPTDWQKRHWQLQVRILKRVTQQLPRIRRLLLLHHEDLHSPSRPPRGLGLRAPRAHRAQLPPQGRRGGEFS